jgi:hypothetical protein
MQLKMQRQPFQLLSINNGSSWQSRGAAEEAQLGAAEHKASDAAHFIASHKVEKGQSHVAKPFGMASPQSLAPTPKRRSTMASVNLDCNVLYGSFDDPTEPSEAWVDSLQAVAAERHVSGNEDGRSGQQGNAGQQAAISREDTAQTVAVSAFTIFSPADRKHDSLESALIESKRSAESRDPLVKRGHGPQNEILRGITAFHQTAENQPVPQQLLEDRLSRASGVHEDGGLLAAGKAPTYSNNLANAEVADRPSQPDTTSRHPLAPKHTRISLPAMGDLAEQPQNGRQLAAKMQSAERAGDTGKRGLAAVKSKPMALRTGLEAPTYPCYTEILQRARLRPERLQDHKLPGKRKLAQQPAGAQTAQAGTQASRPPARAGQHQPGGMAGQTLVPKALSGS